MLANVPTLLRCHCGVRPGRGPFASHTSPHGSAVSDNRCRDLAALAENLRIFLELQSGQCGKKTWRNFWPRIIYSFGASRQATILFEFVPVAHHKGTSATNFKLHQPSSKRTLRAACRARAVTPVNQGTCPGAPVRGHSRNNVAKAVSQSFCYATPSRWWAKASCATSSRRHCRAKCPQQNPSAEETPTRRAGFVAYRGTQHHVLAHDPQYL